MILTKRKVKDRAVEGGRESKDEIYFINSNDQIYT